MKKEAIESAVTGRNYIADLHLLAQRSQLEPHLLSMTVEVHIRVNLLIEFEILLLDRLLVVLINDLTGA